MLFEVNFEQLLSFCTEIIWTDSNAEWFCRTATSVFQLPKFLSPFKKDFSSSLTLSCPWSLTSSFRRQPVFIISDANRFLLTHYSLHVITFLKYLLVLSHVLLNKEEFEVTFVNSSDFWMDPLNNLFSCIFNPIHTTRYVMLLSTANRLFLASCLEPDISAISAVDFGAQHLFTCLWTIHVLLVCYWLHSLKTVLSKSQFSPAGLCRAKV